MSDREQSKVEITLKMISPFLAVAVFVFGIVEFRANAIETRETRRIEATLPYLNKQFEVYIEVIRLVAIIATSTDSEEIETATERFEELYFGELALVALGEVEAAMIDYYVALKTRMGQDDLKRLSLSLAFACRFELGGSWGAKEWTTNTLVH